MKKSVKSLIITCTIAAAVTLLTFPSATISKTHPEPTFKTMIHGDGA